MSLNRLSLRDLQYAVAVAEERHFGRAAARCHVSQPALSAQIRKLEAVLGVILFERTPRGVIVTEPGRRLIAQATRLLEEARLLLDLAATADALAGTLRVDVIATLGPYIVPHILRPLRQRLPNVDFVLREGRTERILASLLSGKTDLALISTPVGEDGLTLLPLFEEPFVAIHPADATLPDRALSIEDLDGAQLILMEEGHCLRDQTLALCRRVPAGAHRHATSLETLRHMVAAGAGHSLLPALAAADRETFGGLVRYTAIEDARAHRTVALAFRSTDPRAAHYRLIADTIRGALPRTVKRLAESAPATPGGRKRKIAA